MADRATVEVYEANAEEYRRQRKAYDPDRATRFAAVVAPGATRLDLGAGPGLYAPLLGRPLVASDPAVAMCVVARDDAPDVPVLCHDAEALPFRRGALGGVWAWKCLQHVPLTHLPIALAEIHRALPVDGRFHAALFRGDPPGVYEQVTPSDDDFPGRRFSWWEPEPLADLLVGAGFGIDDLAVTDRTIKVECRRVRSLPDVVGPGLRLLISGLNPSLYAADAGVNFARPGNRFWPALLAAGLATVDRDPRHALCHHRIGFTDLVKRATARADELSAEEFRAGLGRIERLCELLQPEAVAVCGVTGWRLATGDARATLGWQDRTVGGVRVFVLPNPSGLNAHTNVADLAARLRAALAT